LAATLSTGTAVILQASSNINLAAGNPIVVNNASGDGGHLTLQAGRSITLAANITTDNGDLTLIGNDNLANGVNDAQRDEGDAAIVMQAGTSITAGTGAVTIHMRPGTDK